MLGKKKELEDNLLMVFVGGEHSANAILKSQSAAISDVRKFETQKEMVQLAYQLRFSLESNQLDDFGRILHEGWLMKKSLTSGISTGVVDEMYDRGIRAGALGGKLLGPKERQDAFRTRMNEMNEMSFHFDDFGSKIIYVGDKFSD